MITNPDLEGGFNLLEQLQITLQERRIVRHIMNKFSKILPSDKIISLIRTTNSDSYDELTTELSLEQKYMFYTTAFHSSEETVSG
jgi:hypothetical protein